jgi:hypothetical protein
LWTTLAFYSNIAKPILPLAVIFDWAKSPILLGFLEQVCALLKVNSSNG